MFIESENNKIIKLVNSLKIKKKRDEEGKFVLEGERIVKDALKKRTPMFIIVSENYGKKDFNCQSYIVSEKLFKKISDTKSPQGILAVFQKLEASEKKSSNFLLLNKVSDPGNMGTLIRTALATDFLNVIIDEGCVDIYNSKVLRATMSAIFDVNILKTNDLNEEIKKLQKENCDVFSTALTNNSVNLYDVDFNGKVAVIIGNEANGVDLEILLNTKNITIPMKGDIESLNAGIAGSVAMYEVFRQKEHRKEGIFNG